MLKPYRYTQSVFRVYMELDDFSTNELKNLLRDKQENLISVGSNITRIFEDINFIQGNIYDKQKEIEYLEDEVNELEKNEEALQEEISKIESKIDDHLDRGPFYSYKELEEAGQMVIESGVNYGE